ncbi:hypothetical protein TSUD_168560 [Trifolium subterraneum]|nr:hypothetical protein TSUD_168560 [Trifolium subterraneum]
MWSDGFERILWIRVCVIGIWVRVCGGVVVCEVLERVLVIDATVRKGKPKLGGDEGGVEGLKPGTDGKGNNGGDDLDGGGTNGGGKNGLGGMLKESILVTFSSKDSTFFEVLVDLDLDSSLVVPLGTNGDKIGGNIGVTISGNKGIGGSIGGRIPPLCIDEDVAVDAIEQYGSLLLTNFTTHPLILFTCLLIENGSWILNSPCSFVFTCFLNLGFEISCSFLHSTSTDAPAYKNIYRTT